MLENKNDNIKEEMRRVNITIVFIHIAILYVYKYTFSFGGGQTCISLSSSAIFSYREGGKICFNLINQKLCII